MKFGYGLVTCERHADDPRSAEEIYAEALDLARYADDLGLDTIWTTEHHFVDTEYLPSPILLAAAMAAVTTRITPATGVALAPLYDPVRLAEDAAVTDLLAHGRFILGLGLGWSKVEFAALGPDRSKRGAAMDEILDILAQAGGDQVVHHHGELHDVPEVSIRPKPSRGKLRVWIGGSAESALRRAARAAEGVILHSPIDEFREQIAVVRDELEKAGRDAGQFEVGVYLTIVPDRAGRDAWEEFGDLAVHAQWKYLDMGRSARRVGEPIPQHGEVDPATVETARRNMLTGSPRSIADRLAEYRDVAGPDLHVVARNYLPGAGPERQRELLERFANDVVPLLRD